LTDYEIRILEARDFFNLYKPEWSNALCEERRQLDVLGVGDYDKDKLGDSGNDVEIRKFWRS